MDNFATDYILKIYKCSQCCDNITSEYVLKSFASYENMLKKGNLRKNIIGPSEVDNLWKKHFIPSLKPLEENLIPSASVCLDAGSGAGFPAIPLKILRPDLNFTLCEANRQKTLFLQKVGSGLNLKNLKVLHSRVENLKGAFDIVTSRAMGKPQLVVPLLQGLVKSGGKLLLWTFKEAEESYEGFSTAAYDIQYGGKLLVLCRE